VALLAVDTGMSQTLTCYECGQPTTDYYVDKKGVVTCAKCHEIVQARKDRDAMHDGTPVERER
jgi:hypothetical protein